MAHLTLVQRYEISALKSAGNTQSQIALKMGKNKSVISRELRRNSDGRNGAYKPVLAQKKTDHRHETKRKNKPFTLAIETMVKLHILHDFSPEQIAGVCKKDGVGCVSPERIYQYIYYDKKHGGQLYLHLRSKGKKYAKRGDKYSKRGQITGRIDIDARSKVVEERTRFGDLEIDLVIGKGHKGALITINDRATGLLKMAIVESKEAAVIRQKTIELLQDWKPFLHTITSDNGKEFAFHKEIAQALNIDYYFAHPYHSWERGANENLNGLVRQYFPKKSDFTTITQQQVNQVVTILNNRPRKRLGFYSPNEIFSTKFTHSA